MPPAFLFLSLHAGACSQSSCPPRFGSLRTMDNQIGRGGRVSGFPFVATTFKPRRSGTEKRNLKVAATICRTGGSKNLQRVQHSFDARDFVGAEQVGFAQRGEYGKERLGAADFVAEKFKGVGQGVADWKTERPQPERVQENVHLVPHADGAVLQVAVVKAEAGVQDNSLHAAALRNFDLSRKILAHHFNRVGAQIEIA